MKSPLKWAGGKAYLMTANPPAPLARHLSGYQQIIEPFVGSGTVFLNLNYESGIISDVNPDLIAFFLAVRDDSFFIEEAESLWQTNDKTEYLEIRSRFNQEKLPTQFLYLNRHSFNGLCRYNKSGGFNVPWGQYKSPYFPEKELQFLAYKLKGFDIRCCDFIEAMRLATAGPVVYCDPPYAPINNTSDFTGYAAGGFSLSQHEAMVVEAEHLSSCGVKVVISNNDTEFTRNLYRNASELHEFEAGRSIAGNGDHRRKEKELLVVYEPKTS